MALITCKECNNSVSETAESCPHCGAKIKGKSNSSIQGGDALVVLASFVLGLFLAVLASNLAGEDNIPLRIFLGLVFLIAPIVAALVWSSRRR